MPETATAHAETSPTDHARRVFLVVAICFTLSGAAGLIYEVLWMRMLGLVFGATTIAISVVLTAFMGGLALGSAIAGRLAAGFKNAIRTYGLIEIAIGVIALALPFLFDLTARLDASLWRWLHPSTTLFALIRFLLAIAVLVIPTMLMGATLPIVVAGVRQQGEWRPISVSRLYGLNLLGAIIGTILAGFLLLPTFGMRVTIFVAAITNVVAGIWVLLVARTRKGNELPFEINLRQASDNVDSSPDRAFWLACAFCSGAITIGMQVVWSRVLSMIIGSSTYAFTLVLAIFLLGLAAGAWMVSLKAHANLIRLRRAIVFVQPLILVALFVSLRLTSYVPGWLIQIGFKFDVASWRGLLALQAIAAVVLILIPSILMGMIMPIVLTWASSSKREAKTVGKAYALNTVGAIAGAVVTTFVLIPMASARFAVFCMAAISIVVAGAAYQRRRPDADAALGRALSIGTAAALIMAALIVWPRLNLNELSIGAYDSYIRVLAKSRGSVSDEPQTNLPGDHQLLMYEEGRTATVSVRRDWGITSVAINGRTNASDADDMPTQVMLGELGVLTAPRLEKSLIVGFATGVTAGSVLQSQFQSVECVELERAAIASSRFFEHVNNHPLNDPRLRVMVDDARTYLRVNPSQYDLIISEPSHPWVPGVANLFTREFFTIGRDRLRDDGIFVQWVQIYQLSNESLKSVLATFHDVFPHLAVFRIAGSAKGKDLILIGSREPIRLDLINDRIKEPQVAADLRRVRLNSSTDVMDWFVCDESKLTAALAGAVINTDDNMQVETVAPREAFRPTMDENAAWVERLKLPGNR